MLPDALPDQSRAADLGEGRQHEQPQRAQNSYGPSLPAHSDLSFDLGPHTRPWPRSGRGAGPARTVWDGGTCASAQARLRDVVAAKIEKVDLRLAEFGRLRADLQRARDALAGTAMSGGCGPTCSCMSATAAPQPASPAGGPVDVPCLTSGPPTERPAIACTLGRADLHDRVSEWRTALEHAQRRDAVDGGVQVLLPAVPALTARVAELVALEQQCCSFFEFTLTVRAPGQLLLTATAPPAGLPLV